MTPAFRRRSTTRCSNVKHSLMNAKRSCLRYVPFAPTHSPYPMNNACASSWETPYHGKSKIHCTVILSLFRRSGWVFWMSREKAPRSFCLLLGLPYYYLLGGGLVCTTARRKGGQRPRRGMHSMYTEVRRSDGVRLRGLGLVLGLVVVAEDTPGALDPDEHG